MSTTDFIERPKFACALGGAISTLEGLHRVVPIVHAAGGCANYLSGTYNTAAGYRGVGYCGGSMIPTSNIAENNVVFGGEGRLKEQIENTLFAMDADLYFVITGCQVEIIGDDAQAVAKQFRDREVISAKTPGFIGNALEGYDLVMTSLVENIVAAPTKTEPLTVNIFGVVPGQDVFFKGNLDLLKKLLAKIGVKTNTFFATGDTIADIRTYGNAALSVVLSPVAGFEPAQKLNELYEIPVYSTELPIGPEGSELFLRDLGVKLGIDKSVIDKAILEEKSYYYEFLERIVDIWSDLDFQRYAIVVLDSYYAHTITRFLANDLGWIPHFVAINDIEEEEDQQRYEKRFLDITSEAKPNVVFETNAGLVLEHVRNSYPRNNNSKFYDALSPTYVIGSSIESSLAEKLGAGFLSLAFPVSNRVVLHKGYVGYYGAINLLEDLITNLVAGR
jgi:nitrogenase molybdenum-iron protein beta chain